jgi:hypothetical protein
MPANFTMKKFTVLSLSLLLYITHFSYAQWQPSGATSLPIYYNGGNVGIGTNNPAAKLTVKGGSFELDGTSASVYSYNRAASSYGILNLQGNTIKFFGDNAGVDVLRMTINNAGNVGIGTSTPMARFTVKGGNFEFDGTTALVYAYNRATSKYGVLNLQGNSINLYGDNAGADVIRMTINNTGDVGIGTTTPDAKLAVKGTIHTNEVKVDLLGAVAPDYVFENTYKLPSLIEIQSYINQHKHLPEIPSAKAMEENGMNLKEMNLLLLRKVEELTLYAIEQKISQEAQKQIIDSQTQIIVGQQLRTDELEKKINAIVETFNKK